MGRNLLLLIALVGARDFAAAGLDAQAPVAITENQSGRYEAFPDVCRIADGTLISVFYAGAGHITLPGKQMPRGGRICITHSVDAGANWTRPTTLVDLHGDDRDPSIMQTARGTLICNFMTFYGRAEAPISFVTRVIRSFDQGKTWTEPVDVQSPFKTVTATSNPVIQLDDGTLLLAVYGRDTASRRAEDEPGLRDRSVILRSTDEGATWEDPVFVAELPDVHHQEPSILQLDDGRLLGVLRRDGRQTYSSDRGRTWTRPQPFAHRVDCPYLLQTKTGLLLCASRYRGTSITVSTDRGASWSRPRNIDGRPGAYPSLSELEDGRILCHYYGEDERGSKEGVRSRIFQVVLDANDLASQASP